jgi:hypothetical protein
MFRARQSRGQFLAEFAIVTVFLLPLLIFILEAAFLLQAYLAIQHAAREAARYAVTYQPPRGFGESQVQELLKGKKLDPEYPGETLEEWYERRTSLIKFRAVEQTMGIRLPEPGFDPARYDEYRPDRKRFWDVRWSRFGEDFGRLPPESDEAPFLGVFVEGKPSETEEFEHGHPGGPGLPVRIRVAYRWSPMEPIVQALYPNGLIIWGQAEMVNEGIQWMKSTATPSPPPPSPTGQVPTSTPISSPTPTHTPTSTPTPTPTPTWTLTPIATPTPSDPYIVLLPDKERWTETSLPRGRVELHNHLPDKSYEVTWRDNCGRKTDLGLSLTTEKGSASGTMPAPSSVSPGFRYLCPPIVQGKTYTGSLETTLASTDVGVYVPIRPPDLTIDRIEVPETISVGEAVTVGIVISNAGLGVVSDTFDVDIYVNPSRTPVLKGQAGQGTKGGSSPKQWVTEVLTQGLGTVLNYVIVLPSPGDYDIWAQVDTSDLIEESNEENNILGPVEISLFCSDQCDDFDGGAIDPKWGLTALGARGGNASSSVTENEYLRLEGTGHEVVSADDGKSFMLNQGAHGGNFEMTVQVMNSPGGAGARAGLIVRDSATTGALYVAIAVTQRGGPGVEVLVREQANALPRSPCTRAPIPPYLLDGNQSNGEGIYLRIVREGQTFTMASSVDGSSWHTESCMQYTFSGQTMADPALPGIWLAPNDAVAARGAEYDRFRLCPIGTSGPPPVRPQPPLLRECGNLLRNSEFEPGGALAPWVVGDTSLAVQGSADYSASPSGERNEGHSMLVKMDGTCPGQTCTPWAMQEFIVPDFVSTTQPITVELQATLFSLVPPPSPGAEGRTQDKLWLVLQDGSGQDLTRPVVVAHGGEPERETFRPFGTDVAGLFTNTSVEDHAGQTLQFRLDGRNSDGRGASHFHLDQIRLDVCTTAPPPDPEPDKVYRLGGRLLVVLDGRPTRMSGIDVWATQLPDGQTPPDELGVWTTRSIQDSTYNFFNLDPGIYRIYAEVWVSGNLYSAATTIEVKAGDTVTDANLNLL